MFFILLIFYWGINKVFDNLQLHNIFFSDNYEGEFNFLFKEQKIGNDPTIYLNITSKYEKKDAPEGGENWFVMVNAPKNDGQNWDEMIKECRKNILLKLEKMLNTPIEAFWTQEVLNQKLPLTKVLYMVVARTANFLPLCDIKISVQRLKIYTFVAEVCILEEAFLYAFNLPK